MTDKLIRHLTTMAVLLVAALAATVSYVHIRDLAVTHGGDRLTSALLPLLIDGTVAAMSCVMLRAARLENVSTPWLARVMLAVSVGATLAANTAYGAAYGISGALLWTLPAVMFVGCVEVSVAMVRRTRVALDSDMDIPAVNPEPAMVTIPRSEPQNGGQSNGHSNGHSRGHTQGDRVSRLLLSSPDLTVAQIAARAQVSPRTVARRKAAMAVNGNGKARG